MTRPTRWVGPFGSWGAVVPTDLTRPLPCDARLDDSCQVLHRAAVSAAPPDLLAAWVGQLQLAPYSYDWIDNLGRSPPELASLAPPSVGDRINGIFEVVEADELSVTIRPVRAR